MITIVEAIYALRPNALFILVGLTLEGLDWRDKRPQPTQEEIDQKIIELEAAEPIRLLREERNKRLAETDWTQNEDIDKTKRDLWKGYRKSLRDLPATAEPKLENGILTNITWPEKPE